MTEAEKKKLHMIFCQSWQSQVFYLGKTKRRLHVRKTEDDIVSKTSGDFTC